MIALHSVQQVTSACRPWCAEHDECSRGLLHTSAPIQWWGETSTFNSVRLRMLERADAIDQVLIDVSIDGDQAEMPLSDARTFTDALNELITATEDPA